MKRILVILVVVVFGVINSNADTLREVKNRAFKRGEKLTYRVYYDSWLTAWMTAGIGTMQIKDEHKKFHKRDTYHIVVNGDSKGLFNLFFKVRDRFESYVDEETLAPWHFVRRTREGSYRFEDDVDYNQFENIAKSRRMERDVPPYVQDIVSAFYYVRTFDLSGLQPNEELFVDFHLDDSVYTSRILFAGIDTITVKTGTFRCLAFKPMMVKGEMFDEDYPMTLWVTDDLNHVPIMLESEVIIGSVKIELSEYENLANPLTAKLD